MPKFTSINWDKALEKFRLERRLMHIRNKESFYRALTQFVKSNYPDNFGDTSINIRIKVKHNRIVFSVLENGIEIYNGNIRL